MKIVTVKRGDSELLQAAAGVMAEGFARNPFYIQDRESALEELIELLDRGAALRAALSDEGELIGLIAGTSAYDGNVWELHPLVVRPDRRGHGIGRALVQDLESLARESGAQTLWLGTDDETNQTSLANQDLYPEPLERLRAIRNHNGHPFEFYQKCGFALVGVLPDANGFGKPDIFMAKRIANPATASS